MLVACVTKEVRVNDLPRTLDGGTDPDAGEPDAGPGDPDGGPIDWEGCVQYADAHNSGDVDIDRGVVTIDHGQRAGKGETDGVNLYLDETPDFVREGEFTMTIWPSISSAEAHCLHPQKCTTEPNVGQHYFMLLGFESGSNNEFNAVQLGADQICAIWDHHWYCTDRLHDLRPWEAGEALDLEFDLNDGEVFIDDERFELNRGGDNLASEFTRYEAGRLQLGAVWTNDAARYQFVGRMSPVCPAP